MSDDNRTDGATFHRLMNAGGKSWLTAQLAAWPTRVDPANTTNISFLYGAYRAWIGAGKPTPAVSKDLQEHFDYLESHDA